MSDSAIVVQDLSKKFRIGVQPQRYKALRDTLSRCLASPFEGSWRLLKGRRRADELEKQWFWALTELSFEIKRGQVVGILGSNGAGKSTLLKILSRITEPTTGRAEVHGRVGSLLEVGSGFHPELTGRENIFLNGAILGMSRAEIRRKFDAIVAFSEVEQFLDTPVKRYSSGMHMRLAFAVAAHLEPEILLIDEVLAVGDASFQKKCLGKMNEVSKQGRTILFVSHNMTAIQSLCDRAIWLSGGKLVRDGDAAGVVTEYLSTTSESMIDQEWDDPLAAPGNSDIRLHRARIVADDPEHLRVVTAFGIEFSYWNYLPGEFLNLSLHLYNGEGVCVLNSISPSAQLSAGLQQGTCHIPGNLLNDGFYRVRLMVVKDTSTILLDHADTVMFEIHDIPREFKWYGKWAGAVRPSLEWTRSGEQSVDEQRAAAWTA
ncbi:MAG: polysaccharide ABC transporter ATP-binding protein [Acidobacteriota bacterium]|nr:polysaccharide ABC transporter ATP-binding protein [Acidobacteriota bacterium]